MKNNILLILIILSINIGFGQKIIKEQILSRTGKPLGLIKPYWIKYAIPVSGNDMTYQTIRSLNYANIQNDGFLIRNKFTFTKYNKELEKQWENTLDSKIYGWSAFPYDIYLGDKNAIYFILVSDHPTKVNQLHITRFDQNGNFIQSRIDTKNHYDGLVCKFMTEVGCNLILYKNNAKMKTIDYSLITIYSNDLSYKEKPIDLESSEYESEKMSEVFEINEECIWKELATLDNRVILYKTYFKDIKGTEKKEWVIKSAEVNFQGEISSYKNYEYRSFALENSKYNLPSLVFDRNTDELYLYGSSVTLNNKNSFAGFYIVKFDYLTKKMIFTREVTSEKINDNFPGSTKTEVKFPQIENFKQSKHYVTLQNQGITLTLIRSIDKCVRFTIDKFGDLVHLEELVYANLLSDFNDFILIPKMNKVIFHSPKSEYELDHSPLDFINSLGKKMDTNEVLCGILPQRDCDLVFYLREIDSELKAFKLEK